MKTLLSACLLWTLLSPAVPMACNVCTQLGDNRCLSPFPKGCMKMMDACLSSVLDTNIFGAHQRIPQMGCRSSRLHHTANYSFTSARGKALHFDVRICQTDLCNTTPPQVPPQVLNGMWCPGCFAPGRDACHAVETIHCSNEEYKCIAFAGTVSQIFHGSIKLALQGCATKTFCDLVRGRQADNLFTAKATRVHCVDAKPLVGQPDIKA